MKQKRNRGEYSSPSQRKKYVEEMSEFVRKTIPSAKEFLEGNYGARRKRAILAYWDKTMEEFKDYGLNSVMEAFLKCQFMPTEDYNIIDLDYDISCGAALWMLERLREQRSLGKLYKLLPKEPEEYDAWYLDVSFFHPCYSRSLIESLIDMMMHRYGNVDLRQRIITDVMLCGGKLNEAYEEILSLLPKEDIEKACDTFREKNWDLTIRYMKGKAYYDKKLDKLFNDAIENARTRGQSIVSGEENASWVGSAVYQALQKDGKTLPPLGSLSMDVLGGIASFSGPMGPGFGPARGIFEDVKELDRREDEIFKEQITFFRKFESFLQMEEKEIRKETHSREIAKALSGFTVEDPYEICFALFYLIDKGDDAPWLMHSATALVRFAQSMLPWYRDMDEWEEEDWEEWEEDEDYNRRGWLDQPKQPEKIDFLHSKHGSMNLAQQVYELCRGVVPVGLHPFAEDKARFIEEGMDEALAEKLTDMAELMFLMSHQAYQFTPFEFPAQDGMGEDEDDAEEGEEEVEEAQDADLTNAKLQEEVSTLKKQLKALKNTLALTQQDARSKIAKYEHELKTLRMEHRELADLREIVFHQETEDTNRKETVEKKYSFPYETKKRTVIFGGHDTFLKAIKPMFTNVKFVEAGNLVFSPDIVRNADVVWIQNNCMSHTQFWIIAKTCKLAGVQLRYFSYASAEKCAEQLVTEDQK